MNNLTNYNLALLSTEGKFSCLKTACLLSNVSHDQLTRFLIKTEPKQEIDIKSLPKGGQLIYDDSSINKSFSKKIEKTRWVWCSSLNKAVWGYTLVKIIYVYKKKIYNIADIIWEKEEGSKNDVIRENIKELHEAGLEPEIVLFDCWYNACKSLNLIHSLGWKYLTLVRSNRIFEKKQVKEHKFYLAQSKKGKARGVYHSVQIAKHCDRYIMTNLEKPITSYSGWLIYKDRWVIETVFRALKSQLHLEECHSRSLKAQINHIHACMDTYLYLKNKYPDKSIESARKKYLRAYQNKNVYYGKNLAYAA